jgi:hypothetical protein
MVWLDSGAAEAVESLFRNVPKIARLSKIAKANIGDLKQPIVTPTLVFRLDPVPISDVLAR